LHELARRKRLIELEEVKHNPGFVSSTLDQDLEEMEIIEIVKTCMTRLSPLCQQLLTLFYFEEKSMSEISQITGLANENVAKAKKYQCKNELTLLVKTILKEPIEG
jgi:RNA polymerase sigma factor (sigma-70 family)